YLADLASIGGKVQLIERPVRADEIGRSLKDVTDGVGLRLIRGGVAYGFWRPQAESLEPDDMIMEIKPTDPNAPLPTV
ncbi:MAG TPA: potassium transporter TrkA, partial [Sphingomicrobium sp.]|nr:potassium transporter TrkA [Sphingomicrobium sp.]